MRFSLSEGGGREDNSLYSAAYKECVCLPPYMQGCIKYWNLSRIHSISDFICIQSESLHERNADGKGCQSRLNLKLISSGKHSADEPVMPVFIFRLITDLPYLLELTKQLRAEQQGVHGHIDDSTSDCSC